jgi:hypothetical protein
VVEHVAHLLRLGEQVHGVDADAGVHRPEQQPQRLQAVRHHEGHGVARCDAAAAEPRADIQARATQLGEGERRAALGADGVGALGVPFGSALDERVDRVHPRRHALP